ncbi:MAG: hypothetical protein OSB41_03055 [Kiritimatiellae bacterium]|nr:hypothetical protein [Kiritimatiellia bacterium]
MKRGSLIPLALGLLAIVANSALATVDLVTLPTRESTQLTIYNSADITMVREHRLLTVKKGVNRIQFSWANTLIDPTSIDFRVLDHVDKVDLLDTTFPAGRNDALQWNIHSALSGKVPVEIRYFTSGITWKADYVGMANADETEMGINGYVRVYNNSGETYDNAEVRLVVGTINLVERIADLATRPPTSKLDYPGESTLLRAEIRHSFKSAVSKSVAMPAATAAPKPIVVKQGLSEYFLFTIAGQQDIKNAEPKRLIALNAEGVPLKAIYKLSDRSGAQQFTKYFRFKNQKLLNKAGKPKDIPDMENLGVSPLPDGMVRLFSEYKNRDLAYVGGTSTKYVPIGDRVEVSVGLDTDITIIRHLKDQRISNVISRQYKRRLDNKWVLYYDLIDYDETFVYEEEIVSGKAVDIKVEVERRFDANVVLWSEGDPPKDWTTEAAGAYVDLHEVDSRIEKVDQNHVKYFLDMAPGEKRVVRYEVTYKRRKSGPELNTEEHREPLR